MEALIEILHMVMLKYVYTGYSKNVRQLKNYYLVCNLNEDAETYLKVITEYTPLD